MLLINESRVQVLLAEVEESLADVQREIEKIEHAMAVWQDYNQNLEGLSQYRILLRDRGSYWAHGLVGHVAGTAAIEQEIVDFYAGRSNLCADSFKKLKKLKLKIEVRIREKQLERDLLLKIQAINIGANLKAFIDSL
jgi:hypothetical protein